MCTGNHTCYLCFSQSRPYLHVAQAGGAAHLQDVPDEEGCAAADVTHASAFHDSFQPAQQAVKCARGQQREQDAVINGSHQRRVIAQRMCPQPARAPEQQEQQQHPNLCWCDAPINARTDHLWADWLRQDLAEAQTKDCCWQRLLVKALLLHVSAPVNLVHHAKDGVEEAAAQLQPAEQLRALRLRIEYLHNLPAQSCEVLPVS